MLSKKSFEAQLAKLSLVSSLPLFILLISVMVYANISIYIILLTILISLITITYCHVKIYQKSAYQFRSLSNLLDALVQGDYSLRARSDNNTAALNELVQTINGLASKLNNQRIESVESQLLLQTVINHIDVAIIALNNKNDIILINPAATKLLQLPKQTSSVSAVSKLEQLAELTGGQSKVLDLTFGQQQGKFNVHVEEFREAGKQQKLFFITDVSVMLRSEERNAWQSLVRVISHEINNSLAPIASISQTLNRLLSRQEDLNTHKENLQGGLSIISQRTLNLKNFVNSYKQISQLPEPEKKDTSVISLLNKIIPLYQSSGIKIISKEDVKLFIDPVQIEQVLINLLKNAVESVKISQSESAEISKNDNSGDDINNEDSNSIDRIAVSWQVINRSLKLSILDEGGGINNYDNLFVPFYTTKKQGSGIGLVLCRQILERHGGRLSLSNRKDKSGCLALIELPLR